MSIRFLTLALLSGTGSPQGEPRTLEARVDPRVELVTIVARLAGFREFNMPNSASPYATEVESHFGPYRDHAAVQTLKGLRATNGISYDALASLAVHLDGIEQLSERVPFDTPPERLDQRWGVEDGRRFLTELRGFSAQTDATGFFAAHRELYDEVGTRLSARLSQSRAIPWFDSFFGARPGATYSAIAGLLCGGGNYGVGIRFADGSPEEITPVFGCWTWDESGVPVFGEEYLPLLVHELCHSYTNAFVDRFEQQLAPAGARLYRSCADAMRAQGYGSWQTVLYESLVRASVLRCRAATEGGAAAQEQAQHEIDKHFVWVPDLAKTLAEYEEAREELTTFDAFMPRVVAFFDAYAADLDELDAGRPHLVSIAPGNGASDVEPGDTTLVIRFDRPMRDQSWSIVGDPSGQPEFTGQPSYDAERKVLTVPMHLAPGRTYRFGLNGGRFMGFQSADGVALEPVEVTFTTATAQPDLDLRSPASTSTGSSWLSMFAPLTESR